MPKILTAAAVERIKPDPQKRVEIADGGCTGLRLVVHPTGAKTWAFVWKRGSARGKYTIGSTDSFTLSEARDAAREAAKLVARGIDPLQARKDERSAAEAERRADRDLVEKVVEDYLSRHVSGLKSAGEVSRLLRKELAPWHGRRITAITKRDVVDLLDKLVDRGAPTTANRLRANLKAFLGWCVERDILTASPAENVRAPGVETVRDRVLDDRELRLVLLAAQKLDQPFSAFVKLLAHTGQRRSEVSGMLWTELEGLQGPAPQWRMSPARTKNGREHTVPLPLPIAADLGALPRVGRLPTYCITTTGTSPVSGYSRAKEQIDRHVLSLLRREAEKRGDDPNEVQPLPAWRFHDLRRTAASGMPRLGIQIHVIERLLNHVSGTFGGIVGVYQKHDFADEKRNALDLWTRHLDALVSIREDAMTSCGDKS